jgi:sugar O-acyltransferase (sialic acid O-acetyltransferase NeuD family)
MKKVLLYGAGDLGKIVRNVLKYTEYSFSGFISDIQTGDDVLGDYDYLLNKVDKSEHGIVITVGYKDLINRFKIFESVVSAGFNLPNIIHSNSRVDPSVRIGSGNIIMAGTDIDYNTSISDVSVFWPGTIISHDSSIESNVFLSPNCTLCGYTRIGKNSFIGAGSIIVDRCEVNENSFIKAGSLIKRN